MRFNDPQFFHLLWLVPLLALFLWLSARRKRKLAGSFASLRLLERLSDPLLTGVGFTRSLLLLTGLGLLAVALARPQYGRKSMIVQREGRDIIFLIDTSVSMLADDIQPDRLSRAKFEITSLLGRLEGDRVGLVPFAGDAYQLCPLTTDYSAVSLFLDGLDTEFISEPGTNLARAIASGAEFFDSHERQYRVMVLITDGEQLEGDALEAARQVRAQGVNLYAIGIGSPDGVPIPVRDNQGRVSDYKRDERGEIVMSRLGESLLAELAHAGGGQYYRAGRGAIELERIYEDIKRLEKRRIEAREVDLYHDRYQWFAGAALLLLALESMLWETRRRSREHTAAPGGKAA